MQIDASLLDSDSSGLSFSELDMLDIEFPPAQGLPFGDTFSPFFDSQRLRLGAQVSVEISRSRCMHCARYRVLRAIIL